jgi:hypothetical protein
VKASKVGRDYAFRFNAIRRAIGSGVWLRLLVPVALVLAIALLFVHLFVVIAVGTLVVVVAHSAAQRAMGPGTRIRLRMPPALSARLKDWMWRK